MSGDASARGAPDLSAYRGASVLVTGARGFIGRHLCRALEARGARVVRASREPPADATGPCWLRLDPDTGVPAAGELDALAPDLVFHLAGHAVGQPGPGALVEAVRANVLGLLRLAEVLAGCPRRTRLVIAGTLESTDPMREPARVSTPYSASKAMAEIARAQLSASGALALVSLRFGMVYGHDEPNRKRLVPAVIEALLAGAPVDVSSGTRLEDWLHVDDAVDALVRAGAARWPLPGSLDVGSGRLRPVREVMEAIARAVGGDSGQLLRYGARAERPGAMAQADLSATARALGWSARIGLAEGIGRTVAWHRAQRRLPG